MCPPAPPRSSCWAASPSSPCSTAPRHPPTLAPPSRTSRRLAGSQPSKRERARASYAALVAAGQPVTGARLAEAAGVSASYGRALLAEFQADPTLAGQSNGQRPSVEVGER
jgi:hypothetical protein